MELDNPCQICHHHLDEHHPKMTLMCNHTVHTRCYLMHNLYRCHECQELIISNDMRDEMEDQYIIQDNGHATKKRDKILNLFKTNRVFKKRISANKKSFIKLKKLNRTIKVESEEVLKKSSLNTTWKMFVDEKKRTFSELKKVPSMKSYNKLYRDLKKETKDIEETYLIDLNEHRANIEGEYVKGIYFTPWMWKSDRIIHKVMRNYRTKREIL